jgi:hypothetical protein
MALIVLVACGRLHFDPIDPIGPIDARCPFGPFAPPVRAPNVSSLDADWAPALGTNDLELYFYSFRPSVTVRPDIWSATRPAIDAEFSAPVNVGELNTDQREVTPCPSADGLEIFFSRGTLVTGDDADILVATRADPSQPFSTPMPVPELNSSMRDLPGALTADALTIVLSSMRSGVEELYSAQRATRGSPFSVPVRLAELTLGDRAYGPTLTRDGLTVFFVGHPLGTGNLDVYTATRQDAFSPFSSPQAVNELSTLNDEFRVSLSADDATIYLNYDTDESANGGPLDPDIWLATRSRICQ